MSRLNYLRRLQTAWLGPDEDLSRIALEALAAQGYRNGRLSHSEVGRLLGFGSRWETDAFLKQAGAHLDYTEADLERDIELSRQIK
jgi:hypothetical protein